MHISFSIQILLTYLSRIAS